MSRWVKAFVVALLGVAWLLGLPVAVGLWTGSGDWGYLAFVGTLIVSGFASFLAIEVFD